MALCHTGSLASPSVGKFIVWVRTFPLSSRTITKTPSRVSCSMSSSSKPSPDSMFSAALKARVSAVFSTFDSSTSLSSKKSARPKKNNIAPITRAMNSVRRHRIGKDLCLLQGVACAPDGADELGLLGAVHLFSEIADVDVHEVSCDAILLIPHA